MPRRDAVNREARASFDEVTDNPDAYVSWLRGGDPDLTETSMELIGGVCARMVGLGPDGKPLTDTHMFLERSGEVADHLRERQTFIEGYRDFEESYSGYHFGGIQGVRAGVEQRMQLALVRRKLTVVDAYTLWKSDDNELASYFEMSGALVRQSQIVASETGLIQRHNRTAHSLKGKLMRVKPIASEDFGDAVAKRLLWELLPPSDEVDSKLRQLTAA